MTYQYLLRRQYLTDFFETLTTHTSLTLFGETLMRLLTELVLKMMNTQRSNLMLPGI